MPERSTFDLSTDEGSLRLHIRHNLRPHLPGPAQNPKHRSLGSPSAALGAPGSNRLALVLPLPTPIRFIHVNVPAEAGRQIPRHGPADPQQGTQDAAALQAGLSRDPNTGQPQQKPAQYFTPLFSSQSQRQLARSPVVSAGCASAHSSSENPVLRVPTTGTFTRLSHTTCMVTQVAGV
jgi:hypothetical protein